MHFEPGEVYHVYNRGNEHKIIYFNERNYLFFLRKVRREWLPYCDILAYCLMPNHFHFLLTPTETGCVNIIIKEKEIHMQKLSKAIGKTLSSYTQAINIEQNKTGNLFQKKTKAKSLTEDNSKALISDYLSTCIYYIHQNPFQAGLVTSPLQWPFSSAQDYARVRQGTLCNQKLFFKLSGMNELDFTADIIREINKEFVKKIF